MPFEDKPPAPSLRHMDATGYAYRRCVCGCVAYCPDAGVDAAGMPTGRACPRCGLLFHWLEAGRLEAMTENI